MAANKISVAIGKFVLHASGKSATIISRGIVATSVGAVALNSEQVEEFRKGIRGAFIKGKKDFIRAIKRNSIIVEVWTSSVEAEEKLQARFTSGQLLLDINGGIKLSGIQFDSIEQIEEWKVTEMSQEEFQENKLKATKEIDSFMESLKENRIAITEKKKMNVWFGSFKLGLDESSGPISTQTTLFSSLVRPHQFVEKLQIVLKEYGAWLYNIKNGSIFIEVLCIWKEEIEKLTELYQSGELLKLINDSIQSSGVQFDVIDQMDGFSGRQMIKEEFMDLQQQANKNITKFIEESSGSKVNVPFMNIFPAFFDIKHIEEKHAEVVKNTVVNIQYLKKEEESRNIPHSQISILTADGPPDTSCTTEEDSERMRESSRREENRKEADERRKQERHDMKMRKRQEKEKREAEKHEWERQEKIKENEKRELEMELFRKKIAKLEQTTNDEE